MSGLRLLLVTDAVGGVWIYSLELARALRPLGIETILAVTGPSPTVEQFAAAGDIRLIDTGLPLEWLDTDESQVVNAGKALALIAAREGADIVQTSSAALLAAGAFEQPCVAFQHSCVATWWSAVKGTPLPPTFEWRRDLVAHGLSRADVVVAPSKAFGEATERAYGLANRVLAVHNGRTVRRVRPLPRGDFVFTAARLWDEGKNVRTLDRAATQIDFPFQAAGPTDGPNGASVMLEHLAPLGQLSETKLGGVLAAKPVFASAALYEPFGLSVLEAAQAGCALVLSDIPTHRELWEGAAVFVEPLDDFGFASEIAALLGDSFERERLGRQAWEHARRYSPERMALGMAEIYAQLIQPQAQLMRGAA
jgi:glycosyltransferase involved in cell wall biosynthesis